LPKLLVSSIDGNGSLRLFASAGHSATVERRIPVEGECEDLDGTTVHVLLHVVEGRMDELEIYREDSGPLRVAVTADHVRVLVF
jgi:hypothetical protein